jgi:alanine dehydrogenase
MDKPLTFGFPRMRVEAGERRDFLPETIVHLTRHGARVLLEVGYGSGMGLSPLDYLSISPSVEFVPHEETYQQDYVVLIRCPSEVELGLLPPGCCLISMLHYPTRPKRTELIRSLQIEALSLDSIKDDVGRRLIENLRSVAWNGVEAAFQLLQKLYPPDRFADPARGPIRVTLLGAGAVGVHVVQAAIQYGYPALRRELYQSGVPGVQVTVVDYDTTEFESLMLPILAQTDLLVDATQRLDPAKPVIPNEWIAGMPEGAVLLDLSVDPYDADCSERPLSVKGIEGIPQGNLDQFIFSPDDPAYGQIPDCIPSEQRRHVVSCYSWPGIHPRECMVVYGHQLRPIFRTIIEKGGIAGINPKGRFFERAISRGMLSHWPDQGNAHLNNSHSI